MFIKNGDLHPIVVIEPKSDIDPKDVKKSLKILKNDVEKAKEQMDKMTQGLENND